MITFHDPRGEVATEMEAYTLTHEFTDTQPVTIGLLANGFPDSENFLRALAEVLSIKLPGAAIKVWNKGNASIPAPDTMLAEIKATCQVAIAAYGH
ncbi:MAG: hypothetical protein HKN56_00755 [Gammaproteobacteria bacterium]|nr:hypothetical protein [Gammaproteobacteria bacterium]